MTIHIENSYYLTNTARWPYRIIRLHKYTQVQYLSFGKSLDIYYSHIYISMYIYIYIYPCIYTCICSHRWCIYTRDIISYIYIFSGNELIQK